MTLLACSEPASEQAPDQSLDQPLHVYTVNYPLAWLVEELGGEHVVAEFPVPAGEDPAFWKPGLDSIAAYQSADLVVLNGASYAGWLAQVSLPAGRTLDTSRGFQDQLIYEAGSSVHSHGPEGDHSHGDAAFTLWLDLTLFDQQAQAVAARLVQMSPPAEEAIGKRLGNLRQTIKAWDAELQQIGKRLAGAPILYSHPVYQYLQRRYQLNGAALHWEPGQVPEEAQWEELEALLATHPARLMLWEASPLPGVSTRLQQLGITSVVFSPQDNRPATGDYNAVMSLNLSRLAEAVR